MSEYQVLARKYRPQDFSTLIGQDVMVRTLKNAIDAGRLAHAFVLTGVRGVGKTTTARILAKGLNCTANEGPTVEPCGVCDACIAISESSHVDVLEMDAASRTGIDDIREIIESVRYAPVSARYKVYIIDEVHMLSNQAFNGLLKTLEEPPAHVKFIFATTEIKKLPVTVLSRCQRFDLRRVEQPVLKAHLTSILEKEAIDADGDAVDLIVRAAEGSVRDSLSLLDQAIAHTGGTITLDTVSAMLGFADRNQLLGLLKTLFKGEIDEALSRFGVLYNHGADPAQIISDLLELSHELTRNKVAKATADGDDQSDVSKEAIRELAEKLSIADLTRAWQLLLKGLGEVRMAPKPQLAAEMVLIRLAHAATLPDPATLIKQVQSSSTGSSQAAVGSPAPAGGGASGSASSLSQPQGQSGGSRNSAGITASTAVHAGAQVLAFDPTARAEPVYLANPISFEALVDLCAQQKEISLATELKYRVLPATFKVGHVAFTPLKGASSNLAQKLKVKLKEWTGHDWVVSLSGGETGETLADQLNAQEALDIERSRSDPLVRAVFEAFPDAEIRRIEKPRVDPSGLIEPGDDNLWTDREAEETGDYPVAEADDDGGFYFKDVD